MDESRVGVQGSGALTGDRFGKLIYNCHCLLTGPRGTPGDRTIYAGHTAAAGDALGGDRVVAYSLPGDYDCRATQFLLKTIPE